MKRIEAVIRPGKVKAVCEAMEKTGHSRLMISELRGHGMQPDQEFLARDIPYKNDLVDKARVEVIVADSEVQKVVLAMREAAFTGEMGDGSIFIHPVQDALRIRTAQHGEEAI